VTIWVNGRRAGRIDCRDRGLQYGDGLFETMRMQRRTVRLLEHHLERLALGCKRLGIAAPDGVRLRRELHQAAAKHSDGVLKLIVTRGIGPRGYRPSGSEHPTRILIAHALRGAARRGPVSPVRLRVCATRLGANAQLAGLKTLNRLESVLARREWSDERIWEGLMLDADENVVCGTMSNVFMRRGSTLVTPRLDRCGVAGVMRRWVKEQAPDLALGAAEERIRVADLGEAEEVFMCNAIVGVVSVAEIKSGNVRIRPPQARTAAQLRARLAAL
jgi:4-amino-4-deoxychorismate lyase